MLVFVVRENNKGNFCCERKEYGGAGGGCCERKEYGGKGGFRKTSFPGVIDLGDLGELKWHRQIQ